MLQIEPDWGYCEFCNIKWTGYYPTNRYPCEYDGYIHELDSRCPNNNLKKEQSHG